MVRASPRKLRRRASFETVEFEALLDPVDAAPQVVEAPAEPREQVTHAVDQVTEPPEPTTEPGGEPEQVIDVPPALASTRLPPSRFDAAGTNDDRLPMFNKRARRRR